LFFLSSLSIGGSEKKTVRLANALAVKGWDLSIVYLDGPHTLRDEISTDVNVHYLARRGKFSIGALKRLIRYLTCNKFDLVCCINLYPLIYAYFSRLVLTKSPFKLLATTNSTVFVKRKDERNMFLYAPMLRRIDGIIFGSANQKDLWMHQYKLKSSTAVYIHNGVDLNHFRCLDSESESTDIRAELKIPEAGLVVGSIGRFKKEKQYHVVIQACVELKEKKGLDVYCLLVGGGFKEEQFERQLMDLVVDLGCEKYVFLLNAVDDVRPYLRAMDIFVLSSITETFSNAALESMAMCKPVVLPNVGGCPEMIKPGVTGFIYESGDILNLVEYLYLLGTDKERRLRMGQAARRYAETNFQFESMVDSYVDIFEKTV
jgi:glycosyltransferase involved in cell wall biosynthesis